MELPNFFHAFEQSRPATLADLARQITDSSKKPVGSVTLSELCASVEYPNGLYFLFGANDEPWYIGKCTSRSFIERVPSHFDAREAAWFNTLPKKIKKACQMPTYLDAMKLGLELRLVLLGIKSKQTASKLEGALRGYMQPQLNAGRPDRWSGDEPLAGYEA